MNKIKEIGIKNILTILIQYLLGVMKSILLYQTCLIYFFLTVKHFSYNVVNCLFEILNALPYELDMMDNMFNLLNNLN